MFRSRYCYCALCAALGLLLAALYLFAGTPSASAAAPKGPVSFINDVAPILKKNCFGCHGVKNPKGKLDMTKYESLRKGGTKEDPIVPGKPDDSFIILALTSTDKTRPLPSASVKCAQPPRGSSRRSAIAASTELTPRIVRINR